MNKKRGRPPGKPNANTPGKRQRAIAMRGKGKTWAAIGAALGLTRQGASQLVKRAKKRRPVGEV